MPERKFTMRELSTLLPAEDWDVEQCGPAHCYIYFECDGKTWRLTAKTNTDGEDEVYQGLQLCRRTDKYWDSIEIAEEVVAVKVTRTQFVPVEKAPTVTPPALSVRGLRHFCTNVEEQFHPREAKDIPRGETAPKIIPESFLATTLQYLRACCDHIEKDPAYVDRMAQIMNPDGSFINDEVPR